MNQAYKPPSQISGRPLAPFRSQVGRDDMKVPAGHHDFMAAAFRLWEDLVELDVAQPAGIKLDVFGASRRLN